MKRIVWSIMVAVLVLAVLLLLYQSVTSAQGLGPQDEPPITTQPTDTVEGETPRSSQDEEPPTLAPGDINALVRSAFTYQGKLTSGGGLVNTSCDFLWDIFAVSSGGTSLAAASSPNQLVTNGLFTVVIDVPVTVMDGNARFVEIQVRCPTGSGAYTILSPRQELLAAPYALGLRLPFAHAITDSATPIFSITNYGGNASSPSLLGTSYGGDGVRGMSMGAGSADNGVYGETNSTSTSDAGVKGVSNGTATGGYFTSSSGDGVYGGASTTTNFGGYFTNPSATTSGGALYANGDAKQSLAADGFVKAGVYLTCNDTGSSITRYFNNVNTTVITVIDGSGAGRCTVDFGFNVQDNRYVTAIAYGNGVARIVTFDNGASADQLDFFRFDSNGTGSDGAIMVLIY